MKINTPSLSHTTSSDWEKVYEPSEDSFLLIDALENDLDYILRKKPSICLEIGSGSGIVSTALSLALKNASYFLATDINPDACALTSRTANANSVDINSVQADLTPFRTGMVDLVIFNPPYVPTPSSEVCGKGLERSWAGGLRGREVIDRFIEQVVPNLASNALGYLLLLEDNNPDEVIEMLKSMSCKVLQINSRKIRGEHLFVIRFEKCY